MTSSPSPSKKRESLSKFGFDEGSNEAQEAYKKNILNPEQTNHDPRKQKWV